jgi:hypothetical protein
LCAASAKIQNPPSIGRRKERILHQNSDEIADGSSLLTHYIIYSVCASVAGWNAMKRPVA